MRGGASTFPTTYRAYTTETLLAAYMEGPSRLRRAVGGLSESELSARPRLNKWSIFEVAMHLTDAELVGAARVRLTIAEPGADFIAYDQDTWAKALCYQMSDARSIEASLRLFDLLRETTGRLFLGARRAQWLNSGNHPQLGPLTLRNILEFYADHSERHVQQILAMRRLLNRSLDLPSVLPERLY